MALLSSKQNSEALAADRVSALFHEDGWDIQRQPCVGSFRPDWVAGKGAVRYVIELKSMREGRPDRVIALLSQAILEAGRYADHSAMKPLAIVHVSQTSASLWRKVEQFHSTFAPHVAIGIVSEAGESHFIGPSLEALNVKAPRNPSRGKHAKPHKASDLFSDLNQWMLKVLLAPELPEHLLTAPRRDLANSSQLADAANVSAMSASRFVRRLQEEGFLDDSGSSFQLVRRQELFHRWRSAAMRSSPELRMSYLIPASGARQLHKVVSKLDACVGLFAAADLLRLGHVSGVAPYVYVRRLMAADNAGWPGLVSAAPGEPAQIILKQSNVPGSLFRGAVRVGDMLVSDVLQIWLDASGHPARGVEQAEFLRSSALAGVLREFE
ncbi:MAG: hypothetical protein IPF83_12125 [Rhodanobacteraceae bacterium]|nr:hypothetical protein [Rhodanobacteraceae bacterium]MBK7044205.1 hypothetical protein [Rhodanobacteraceae bacterium]MBP9154223.1 hypothetical protein [Xanthomonadales bacterium]HQW80374.1 hypothetical protein [Pseudomonadota bacterium]